MKKEEIIINVIFDAAKGSVSVESREAACGKPIGVLPRPSRAGYDFDGWYLNAAPVTEETVVDSEEDIRLVAHWVKKKNVDHKASMLKKQKTAVAVLAGLTAVLILALFIVNHIVAIYPLEDVWYDDNGVEYTEKYYIKKKNGSYGLYDKKGNAMEVNSDGYFIANSGNQYSIDADTGKCKPYAVVDYDAAGGELLGFSDRIMIFPQITQKNVYSLEVTNTQDDYSYRFYRDENGTMHIEGSEDSLVTFDESLFASLCVSCGYPLTMKKLDLVSEKSTAPRLEDGSIDYSAYGLADLYDGEGNLIYTPTVYTITKAIYGDDGTCREDPEVSYTVKIGDAILSDGGYYVQLEGRAAVYIVSPTIADTVLQPVETLVTPMITYPVGISYYSMVNDFLLGKMDFDGDLSDIKETDDMDIHTIVNFTYQDLDSRLNTIYAPTPYISQMELENYRINADNVDIVLGLFYDMEFLSCKKLGLTKEALEKYNLTDEVYYLAYGTPVTDSKGYITGYVENQLLVSPKTPNNTYYVASFLFDMIVEVDQYYFSFLEWDQNAWYAKNIVGDNIAYVKTLTLQIGDKTFEFTLDNSESDQGEQISSSKMKVFCEQFLGGKADPNLLDYTITYTYQNDAGKVDALQVTGLENFQKFYIDLLKFSIAGDFDEGEEKAFEKKHGMSVEDYIARGEEVCDAIIYLSVEDLAATLNDYTYEDEDGEEVKLYTENNKRDIVIRVYRYSEGRCYLTLETVEDFDENGDPITDPKNGVGAFYVLLSDVEKLLEDIELLLAKQPIEPKGDIIEIVN